MTKILVVEDEASFSDALAYLLGKEGFEVIVADTGPAAIEQFDRHGADLVLLDLMLPGLSGTEVCRQLRTRSNVPIIMLTAKDAEDRYQSAVGLKHDLERCSTQYKSTGDIADFELGLHERVSQFHIPEKLYGREKEIKALFSK